MSDAADNAGKKVADSGNKTGDTARKFTTNASAMRTALTGVSVAAAMLGGKVQNGTSVAAQGVSHLTTTVTKADRAFAEAATRAERLSRAAGHFKGRSWGLGLVAAAQEAHKLSDELMHAENRARSTARAMATIKGPNSATAKSAALGTVVDDAGEEASKFNSARNLGVGMLGIAGAGGYAISRGVAQAGQKEVQLKTIEKFTGSEAGAQEVYNEADSKSLTSVYSLKDLVQTSKTLSKNRIFDKRRLTASDDLAAANFDEGTKANDVALQFGKIRNGQTGEAFERLGEFGVTKEDLKAQGLKFSASGEYEDKSEAGLNQAIEAVTKVIEAKFGGLSEKLATETMSGALSNLDDAFARVTTSIGGELVPAVTAGARAFTAVASWFAGLSQPVRAFIAWGGVLAVALIGLVGAGIAFTAICGQVAIGYAAISAAGGTAAFVSNLFSMSLISRLTPAMLINIGGALLLAAALYGAVIAFNGTRDAAKMSNAELEKTYPVWSHIWNSVQWVADKINTVFDWLAEKATWLANKLTFGAVSVYQGQNTFDKDQERKLYNEDIARRKKYHHEGVEETFDSWEKKRNSKYKGMSDGDQDETNRKPSAPPSLAASPLAPSAAPNAMPSDMPEMADYNKRIAVFAQAQPATLGESVSAPTIPGAGPAATMPADSSPDSGFVGSTSAIESLQDAIRGEDDPKKKKALQEQLIYARRAESHRKTAEAEAKRAAKISEREAKDAAIQAGISSAPDARTDAANIKDLRAQLEAAQLKHDDAKVKILNVRIRRATAATSEMKAQEHEANKADAKQRQIDAFYAKQALDNQIEAINAQVRAGAVSKSDAKARISALRISERRKSLGLEGGSAVGTEASPGQNSDQIGKNEARWIGYARRIIGELSREEARGFVDQSSARFEGQGGFQEEAEMQAFQRAFQERYGRQKFTNAMFPNGIGQSGRGGFSGAPGALASAAAPVSFGDGSTTAGGDVRPQLQASGPRVIDANLKTTLIERGNDELIIRIHGQDIKVENGFARGVQRLKKR